MGFLSNQFIIAPKTSGYPGGVGDDDYGWGVDGQHALRWHSGKKLPWDRYWSVSEYDPFELEKELDHARSIAYSLLFRWLLEPFES